MKPYLTPIFALLLICAGSGAALASTPDGQTPALETVCDAQTGAAYGLCNAYCEAMDCELANDGDPGTQPNASAAACSKVRTKFQQATGQDVPCEETCPCARVAGSPFAQVLSGQIAIQSCFKGADREIDDGVVIYNPNSSPNYPAFSTLSGGRWGCGVVSDAFLPLTPEQGQDCAQRLEQAANSQGVTCVPPQ